MKHKDEICRWANCPDGTKVWIKDEETEWYLGKPIWFAHRKYIVNDAWAEIRKAFVDGKTIEYKDRECWIESIYENVHNFNLSNLDIENYRIKPETIHEWQWYQESEGVFYLSHTFHTNTDGFPKDETWHKFEPSKRIKNDN